MAITLPPLEQLAELKKNPWLVSAAGTELYIWHPSGIIQFTGVHFGFMSDEEIRAYLTVQTS